MRVMDSRKVQPPAPEAVYHVHLELKESEIIQLQRNRRALLILSENLDFLQGPRPAMPNIYVMNKLAETVIEVAASQR